MAISQKRKKARESNYQYYYSKGRAKRIMMNRRKKRELTKRGTSSKIKTRR